MDLTRASPTRPNWLLSFPSIHQSKFSLQKAPGGPASSSLHPLLLLKDFLTLSLAASTSIPGAIFETSPISAGNTLFPVSGRSYVTWFRCVGYLHFPYHKTPEKKQLKERRACFGSRFEEIHSVLGAGCGGRNRRRCSHGSCSQKANSEMKRD